jgi:5-formyltetrahydrofolate cyclo-ligase
MSVADEKKYLRAILKRTRGSIAPNLAATLSARVQSRIVSAAFYNQSFNQSSDQSRAPIVLYAATGNEVSTETILDDALAADRQVLFPRLDCAAKTLSLGTVRSRSDLSPGAYGILEPKTATINPASISDCLVLVPGLAFSPRGERLGRGGGHYDRLLAELSPQAVTVGLAYSFQLLDRVPQSGWDRRLNFVVTETAVYRASDAIWSCGSYRTGGIPK